MGPRILVIVDDEHDHHHLVMALARIATDHSIEVVTEGSTDTYQPTFGTSDDFCGSTDLCNLVSPKPEPPPRDYTEWVMQGIADLTDWLERHVAWVLSAFGCRRQRPVARARFQPCWRAGRWKSLT